MNNCPPPTTENYMIEHYSSKEHLVSLLDYLSDVEDDFYITEDNKRITVNNRVMLIKLLKQSSSPKIIVDKDVKGFCVIWKSVGNNVPRHYIKMSVTSVTAADQLLTSILWNEFKPLYIKLKKDSPYLNLFKSKGFIFQGDRGKEVLLTLNNTFRKKYVNNQPYNKDTDTP